MGASAGPSTHPAGFIGNSIQYVANRFYFTGNFLDCLGSTLAPGRPAHPVPRTLSRRPGRAAMPRGGTPPHEDARSRCTQANARSSTRRYVHCRPPEWRCCRRSPFPGASRLIVALSGWRKAPPGSGKKGRPPRGGRPSRRLGVSRGVGGVVIPLPFPGGLVCGRCCWLLFYVRPWDSFTIRYGLY